MPWMFEFYFRPKWFEQSGKIYEFLGVRLFKKYIPSGDYPFGLFRSPTLYSTSSRALKSYESFYRLAEIIHLIGFMVVGHFCVLFFTEGDLISGVLWVFMNILVNLYPVFIQRYNRARVYLILERRTVRITKIKNNNAVQA